MAERICYETGTDLGADAKDGKHFSSDAARTTWNNRRKNRGAIIYDLLMAWRYDRPVAKALNVFSTICKLLAEWHREDGEAGRIGYNDPNEVMAGLNKEKAP